MIINSIKRYIFEYASSNMYVIAEDNSALVVDPNISESAVQYLKNRGVSEITVLLSHEHYDHTSGLTWICEKFMAEVICHEETAKSLRSGKNSRPIIIASSRMGDLASDELKQIVNNLPQKYSYNPDITFLDKYILRWKGHEIRMISTPGHSKGSCCIEIDDNIVVTGDSLILGTPVITRFPGGSREQFCNVTLPYLSKIDDNSLILPGHGETFFMKDMRNDNKRNIM